MKLLFVKSIGVASQHATLITDLLLYKGIVSCFFLVIVCVFNRVYYSHWKWVYLTCCYVVLTNSRIRLLHVVLLGYIPNACTLITDRYNICSCSVQSG